MHSMYELTNFINSLTHQKKFHQLIAKGRIEDTDYARETVALSKQQILTSAASQMLLNAQNAKKALLDLI